MLYPCYSPLGTAELILPLFINNYNTANIISLPSHKRMEMMTITINRPTAYATSWSRYGYT